MPASPRSNDFLSDNTISQIAEKYGIALSADSLIRHEKGYRNRSHSFIGNDGNKYNFILYKDEDGISQLIKRINRVSELAATVGLPVRRPADTKILQVGHRFGALYNYLDGQTIPWESFGMKHIKLAGSFMAKLHQIDPKLLEESLPDIAQQSEVAYSRMKGYLTDTTISKTTEAKLGLQVQIPNYSHLFDNLHQHNLETILHMDMVRGNLLFQDEKRNTATPFTIDSITLSGVIDFEKVAIGHPLFDIARSLAFLLVDSQKSYPQIIKYFIDSGYRKRGGGRVERIQIDGQDVLTGLISFYLLYDFYKFLKQNPYESLHLNHHYRKTKQALLSLNVLQLSQ